MATHVFPDRENRPWLSLITNPKLQTYAIEAKKLLSQLPQLKVWEIQKKGQGYSNNCLYVGMASKMKPYLLNFTIISSNLNVEFRFSQHKYLPNIFDLLKWQNSSWRYADINTYGLDHIKLMIETYIKNIRSDYEAGLLKPGGGSFAEEIIFIALKDIFPDIHLDHNIRLDELRSIRNTPLELDFFIRDVKLAIEVQGPQHFREVYGSNIDLQNNDKYKKTWCRDKNIKLIWMNWERINLLLKNNNHTDFLKKYLQDLINRFLDSEYLFLWWKNSKDFQWE